MRTEDQKVSQDPITVVLGGKDYPVKLLVIKDSREWRKKAVELLASLPQYANVTTDDPDAFSGAMNALISAMPDSVTDLFFQYAKDLDRDEIESVATDQEMAAAFEEVLSVAFPLVGSMSVMAEKIAGSASQSEKPLSSS